MIRLRLGFYFVPFRSRFGFGFTFGPLLFLFELASNAVSVPFEFGFGSLRIRFGSVSDSVSVRFGFGRTPSGGKHTTSGVDSISIQIRF